MNNKFDELTKGMAQSVTRRAALKKFGVCVAGALAAALGIGKAAAAEKGHGYFASAPGWEGYSVCMDPTTCQSGPISRGAKASPVGPYLEACGYVLDLGRKCTF